MIEVENPIPDSPDKCAATAEGEYRKVCSLGRRKLLAALEVGRLMTEAKKQLGHGKWEPAVKKWREDKTITFSPRSLRRWMLMAKYEKEIISAELADLTEAEKYAQNFEKGEEEGGTTVGDPEAEDATETRGKAKPKDPKEAFEDDLVKTIQKIPEEERRDYLQYVIDTASKHLARY